MDKQGIYELLKSRGLWHEITEHKAVYNMAELAEIDIPYPEADAKNLFLRDDKKKNYYLVTVKGDKRVDIKEFRRANELRPLSFASEEELFCIMGLHAGSVTPFGLLNDEERRVTFFIDRDFFDGMGLVGVHPNENTATVWLKADELLEIIKEHGNEVKPVYI